MHFNLVENVKTLAKNSNLAQNITIFLLRLVLNGLFFYLEVKRILNELKKTKDKVLLEEKRCYL